MMWLVSIKNVRSQVGGGLSNADKGEVVLLVRTPEFFIAKTLIFYKNYGVSATPRVNILKTFLWTAPNNFDTGNY